MVLSFTPDSAWAWCRATVKHLDMLRLSAGQWRRMVKGDEYKRGWIDGAEVVAEALAEEECAILTSKQDSAA